MEVLFAPRLVKIKANVCREKKSSYLLLNMVVAIRLEILRIPIERVGDA